MLLRDPAAEAILGDAALAGRMLEVEIALARAQAAAGVIPPGAAPRIAAVLAPDPRPADWPPLERLRSGALGSAVPVPALVGWAREVAGADGRWVHFGATSQDIWDTALVLGLRAAAAAIRRDLARASAALAAEARAHAQTVLVARTWTQPATPTLLGLRLAGWRAPLARAAADVPAWPVQLGGAVGTLSAMAPAGTAVRAALAAELGLADRAPWHTDRAPVAAVAAWAGGLVQGAARMGSDLLAFARTGGVSAGAGGGSSTMPHKRNPVQAAALVALGRLAAADLGLLAGLAHGEERDGSAWLAEADALPRLMARAGAAARLAAGLAETLAVDPAALAAEIGDGAVLAEPAAFALAERMPLPEAQALVKRAAGRGPLFEALAAEGAALDRAALLDPARLTGHAAELIEAALAE